MCRINREDVSRGLSRWGSRSKMRAGEKKYKKNTREIQNKCVGSRSKMGAGAKKYKKSTREIQNKCVGISVKDERWSKAGISMRAMDLKIHHSVLGQVSSSLSQLNIYFMIIIVIQLFPAHSIILLLV